MTKRTDLRLLGVALGVLLPAAAPCWAKGLMGAVLVCAALMAALGLLLSGLSARRNLTVPGETAGTFAQIQVVDPGAMGRVRYYATEQRTLLSLGEWVRVGLITGRDSAASGAGKYGFAVDWYFDALDGREGGAAPWARDG